MHICKFTEGDQRIPGLFVIKFISLKPFDFERTFAVGCERKEGRRKFCHSRHDGMRFIQWIQL